MQVYNHDVYGYETLYRKYFINLIIALALLYSIERWTKNQKPSRLYYLFDDSQRLNGTKIGIQLIPLKLSELIGTALSLSGIRMAIPARDNSNICELFAIIYQTEIIEASSVKTVLQLHVPCKSLFQLYTELSAYTYIAELQSILKFL